jgi:hypothetical protein
MERVDYRWEPTPQNALVKLIIQLHQLFPDTKEDDLRHSLLSALCGTFIDSQKEIPANVTNTLIDITGSTSYFDEPLATELQDRLLTLPYGTARFLPATNPAELALSILRNANQPVGPDGHSRSADHQA